MHILIIRFSSMGDIVIQTPIINWLKSQIPNLKITFLTSKEYEALVSKNTQIDNVIYFERKKGMDDFKQLSELAKIIRTQVKPDFILDLHNTLRAKILKFLTPKIPKMTINKRSFRRALFIKLKLNFFKNLETHHERIIVDLHQLFHLPYYRDDLEEFVATGMDLNGKLTNTQNPVKLDKDCKTIVISPIASFEPKRWPIESYKELIELILNHSSLNDFQIKIVAGPDDNYCDVLNSDFIISSKRVENLQGKTTLNETNQILSTGRLCITNDTGAGHISEAFGVPVISVFGPTSEYFGFRPHLKKSEVVSRHNLWCRPCSADGKKKCFRKEQYCMSEITPEFILTKVLKQLGQEESHV